MLRTSWKAMALGISVCGTAGGAEPLWKSSSATATVQPTAVVTPVKTASAAGVVWRASGSVVPASAAFSTPLLTADSIWKASHAPTPPRVIESSEPLVDAALTPASMQVPIPSVEPPPVVLPPVAKPIEVAPRPTPVEPSRPAIKESKSTLSVHAPTQALTTPMPTVDESTAVWGAYNQPGRSATPVLVDAPMRHHTFGSQSLHLSRDYHFLDGLKKPGREAQLAGAALAEPVASNCFVEGEYLLWWVNNGEVPALATTSTNNGFGFLGEAGTVPLIGPGPFGQSQRSGVRLRAGTWLDDCHECGLDASVFVLGSVGTSTAVTSGQFPIIARPFFAPSGDSGSAISYSELVAYPGRSTGSISVESTSFLWGADVNYRRCLGDGGECFAGYRYLNLQETLTITEFVVAGPLAPITPGTSIVVRDQFTVKNNFHGGQVGGLRGWQFGEWSLEARGSVALGVTTQNLAITGAQARTQPGQGTQAILGGLLAVGPNLGEFNNSEFSVVPEATLAVGYRVRPNLKAYFGYNFMAWTNVLRPGDAVDRVVNVGFVPQLIDPLVNVPSSSVPRPQPQFNQSTLYINGITFGLEGSW